MPVLMNKGDNPRRAAWLFWTDRDSFAETARAVREERMDAGVLEVDEEDLAAARKGGSEVPVYLRATELVPDDVDLEALFDELAQADAEESGSKVTKKDEAPFEERAEVGTATDDEQPYDPVPVPEGQGNRVRMGTTTAQAARAFITERDLGDDGAWSPELPGLQALVHVARVMGEAKDGGPAHLVWHVDADGIMRMAPARDVKPMAGNILKVKL